jgi:hypothetical protein
MVRELELLTRAGFSPLEALAASTSVTARHFGPADRGRITRACVPTWYWSTATRPGTSPPAAPSPRSGAAASGSPADHHRPQTTTSSSRTSGRRKLCASSKASPRADTPSGDACSVPPGDPHHEWGDVSRRPEPPRRNGPRRNRGLPTGTCPSRRTRPGRLRAAWAAPCSAVAAQSGMLSPTRARFWMAASPKRAVSLVLIRRFS